MKRREIKKALERAGWWLKRTGKHEIWTNGTRIMPIPSGSGISNTTAKAVMQCIRGKGPFSRMPGTQKEPV